VIIKNAINLIQEGQLTTFTRGPEPIVINSTGTLGGTRLLAMKFSEVPGALQKMSAARANNRTILRERIQCHNDHGLFRRMNCRGSYVPYKSPYIWQTKLWTKMATASCTQLNTKIKQIFNYQ
jgi:hypothetical protein